MDFRLRLVRDFSQPLGFRGDARTVLQGVNCWRAPQCQQAALTTLGMQEFFERFAVGFRNYEAGEWLVARDLFLTCHYSEAEMCTRLIDP